MYGENLVICDCEEQYAKNLLQVLSNLHQKELSFYLFYTFEDLKKFAEEKQIDRLLIAGEYPREKRDEISANMKFVLVRERQKLSEDEKEIFRYQSADMIWEQLQEAERDRKKGVGKTTGRIQNSNLKPSGLQVDGRLIGVYSPIHRIGKTRFALEMGKQLAENGPVLYLNLESYAGGDGYFPEKQKQNLGDLLYYSRQEQTNLGMRISMMAGQLGKLDYIEPIFFTQDLSGVRKEDWQSLLKQILSQCIYEKIILDLGESVNGLFEILEMCDVIFTPYIDERISKMKLNQYTENLRKTGLETILEKTIQKKMQVKRDGKNIRHSEKGVEKSGKIK